MLVHIDMSVCAHDYFCVHVCGLSRKYWPTLMLLCLYEFHTTHINADVLQRRFSLFSFLTEWAHFRSAHRLRESSLSLMIYGVSGLDEPPLDVSPTPTWLAVRQCRLQYTKPYVGSWASYTEAKTLPCHSGRTFSSLYIRRIPPCVITYNGSTGGFSHKVICPCCRISWLRC